MKFFSRLFVSLLLLLAVANHGHAASQDVFDQIIKKGEIRVGISVMAPWVMKDKDGNYIGFEIDIAKQLGTTPGQLDSQRLVKELRDRRFLLDFYEQAHVSGHIPPEKRLETTEAK